MTAARCLLILVLVAGLSSVSHADIFRWDNGQLILGTEGIKPGPGVDLSSSNGEWNTESRNLRYADFSGGLDLVGSTFSRSWLDDADFSHANLSNASLTYSTLTNANLTGAIFIRARLDQSTLTNADLTGAVVTGASLADTTSRGLTKAQLESTASYQTQNLQGIKLYSNDLTGWDFSRQDLTSAQLHISTLTNANMSGANLARARLDQSTLTNAKLNGANLSGATLSDSMLTNVDLTGAVVTAASFQYTTSRGFTKAQLESTASYQSQNLEGIKLSFNDLSGWDFSGHNLTNAGLVYSTLTNANLSGANLTNAVLAQSTLTNADLTGAIVKGASFHGTSGFSFLKLKSTASYQSRNLQGIGLDRNELSGWDFSGQDLAGASLADSSLSEANFTGANLTGANLDSSTLFNAKLAGANLNGANLRNSSLKYSKFTEANLTGANLDQTNLTSAHLDRAVVTGAGFSYTTSSGFIKGQLESTASYRAKNLQGIRLAGNNLSGWDFSGQDLTGAGFSDSILTNADLTGAMVTEASFNWTTSRGFTKAQLESTASYQAKNLQGIGLYNNDLTGWDFRGQNLTGANLGASALTNVDLSGAVLTGALLNNTTSRGFTKAQLEATASYQSQNLQGIGLWGNDLTGWEFPGQNLTNANLVRSTLTNVNLTGAVVTGADFSDTTSRGFTKAQLESTVSYQLQKLQGIGLNHNDLTGWDFSGQNLTNAGLMSAILKSADFSVADTRGAISANLAGSIAKNTIHPNGMIISLNLGSGEQLVVRDYDGDPNRSVGPILPFVRNQMLLHELGSLHLIFDADSWDSTIWFQPGIPVQLGGKLELTFADDVDITPQIGRTIRIFDWTGVEPTGTFTVASVYPWDLSKLYTEGEVTLLLPGDTNGDQAVNIADLNNVRNNFGTTGGLGDTNGDQKIDIQDLNNVRNFFGASTPQTVPEPATSVIACVIMASIAYVVGSGKKRQCA